MTGLLQVYGSMGIVAGIAQGVYLVTAFSLGAQLLLRARRSHEAPELLLGLHLLLALGLGYLLISTALAAALLGSGLPPAVSRTLIGGGYLATVLGLLATLIFNRRVFHPTGRRALGLVWLLGAIMLIGWAGFGLRQGFPPRFEGAWLWTLMGGIIAANLWVAFEPLRYFGAMRRRARLGLADPLVVDRFLLWGCGSLARTAMAICGPLAVPFVEDLDTAAAFSTSSLVLGLAACAGLVTAVSYWLTFRPTPRYTRWVARRYRATST